MTYCTLLCSSVFQCCNSDFDIMFAVMNLGTETVIKSSRGELKAGFVWPLFSFIIPICVRVERLLANSCFIRIYARL